jgi:uncharacterized membrane protein YphA (DoxX/SURF4 family)
MKIAGLVIGILLLILSGIGFVVSLALPALTENRVSFEESMFGLIPAALVFFFALLLTIVFAILLLKGRGSKAKVKGAA